MKANKLLFVFCVFVFSQCDTANNVEPRHETYFIKYYGTEGDQTGVDIIVNNDGTMILLGNSVLPTGVANPFLIKTDPRGNLLWELNFGANEMAVDVEVIKNGSHVGSYVVASNVGNEENSKIRLWRISASGTFIDSLTVTNIAPAGTRQYVNSVTSLEVNEGFVVTGYSDGSLMEESSPETDGPTDKDILAFRVNDSFSIVENVVSKGGELNGSGVRIYELPNDPAGKMVLFSYTDRPFLSNAFGFNFSYDIIFSGVPVGNLVGTEEDREVLASVVKTPLHLGEGFLMAGTSIGNGGNQGRIYLVKFNSTFEYKGLDKKLDIGLNLECVDVDTGVDGYYILANELNDTGLKNLVFIRTRPDGEPVGFKKFGALDGDDSGGAIASLPDGRIAIVATMGLKTRKKLALIVVNNKGEF